MSIQIFQKAPKHFDFKNEKINLAAIEFQVHLVCLKNFLDFFLLVGEKITPSKRLTSKGSIFYSTIKLSFNDDTVCLKNQIMVFTYKDVNIGKRTKKKS